MGPYGAFKPWKLSLCLLITAHFAFFPQAAKAEDNAYAVVDTAQTQCYDESTEIPCPSKGGTFYGQDAQYTGKQPSFTDNNDGTVTDNVTGFMWQKSPDTNGDGKIDADDKLNWTNLQNYPQTLNARNFGGYSDWRLPSIKELYSLIDFRGGDPSGYSGSDTSGLTPFIDTDYFDFGYGDTSAGERIIDAQYASSTIYVSTPNGVQKMFGVNFADGRIKGYGVGVSGSDNTFYVICVRGNTEYGINDFVDNGDGTITDNAAGLMWSQADSGEGMTWEEALAWVEEENAANYLGHNDWRLPNAKELQSIVDYTRSPDTSGSAAIDPLFRATGITNEAGQDDFPFYWSSTTHANYTASGKYAVYVAFGRAPGYMNGSWVDVHGAGAQRSDPKSGDPADYPYGHGPQGDAIRIYNYVRLVRGTSVSSSASFTASTTSGTAPLTVRFTDSSTGNPTSWSWDFGDGGTSTEQNPSHTYSSAGTYSVSLTVNGSGGSHTITRSDYITVTTRSTSNLTTWNDWFAVDTKETPMVGDFNGDGKTDIITFTRDNASAVGDVYVSLSDGTKFGSNDKWNDWFAVKQDETIVVGDFNGDGIDDIAAWLGKSTKQIYVATSYGSGMNGSALWLGSIGDNSDDVLKAADVDADGKWDLVLFSRHTGKVYVALSNGTGFDSPQAWHSWFAVSTYEGPEVGDVDGDGRADIITFATDSPTSQGDVYVSLSTGNQFGDGQTSTKWSDWFAVNTTEKIRIGDMNGDGTADFATFLPDPYNQVYVVYSQGSCVSDNYLMASDFPETSTDLPFLGDVDGDGKADLILFRQGDGKVYVMLTQ